MQTSSPNGRSAVVIYHAHCNDGMAAAWAFYKNLENTYPAGVAYVPMNYGELPEEPAILGKHDVYILDFSFPKEIICDLAVWYNKVVLLDHHKTAIETLGNWENRPPNLTMILDSTRSGAMITWEYSTIEVPPKLIQYVQDYDLWKHELPNTRAINAYIKFTKKTISSYENLAVNLEENPQGIALWGSLLLEQIRRMVDSIIATTSRPVSFLVGETKCEGLMCNSPPEYASDIGNILAIQSGTFGATFYIDRKGDMKISIRSIGNYDVSAIAKVYGGGGHKNASGFTIPSDRIKFIEGF